MVAANVEPANFPDALDGFIRTGAVADHVAQVDRHIEWRRRLKASLKSFKITVNIAD